MKRLILFLPALLFLNCASLSTRQKAILILAPTARVIEAARDSEAFEHPTNDRSAFWHAAKIPQYGIIAIYGYCAISEFKKEPSLKNAVIVIGSLGIAWGVFEASLWTFRELQK
jgi:hypothetical protein